MSGTMKTEQRAIANPASDIALDTNEKILRTCHELYTTKETGEILCLH